MSVEDPKPRSGDRRKVVRRRGDRFDRWLNRGALVVLVALYIYGATQIVGQSNANKDRIDDIAGLTAQIQSERVRNTVKACERRNDDHRQQVAFLTGLVPREKKDDPKAMEFIRKTEAAFPIVDCEKQVREQVKPSP